MTEHMMSWGPHINTVMVVKAAEGANTVYVVIVKAAVSGKAV